MPDRRTVLAKTRQFLHRANFSKTRTVESNAFDRRSMACTWTGRPLHSEAGRSCMHLGNSRFHFEPPICYPTRYPDRYLTLKPTCYFSPMPTTSHSYAFISLPALCPWFHQTSYRPNDRSCHPLYHCLPCFGSWLDHLNGKDLTWVSWIHIYWESKDEQQRTDCCIP